MRHDLCLHRSFVRCIGPYGLILAIACSFTSSAVDAGRKQKARLAARTWDLLTESPWPIKVKVRRRTGRITGFLRRLESEGKPLPIKVKVRRGFIAGGLLPVEGARGSSDQYEGEKGAREVPSLRVNGKDYLGPVGSHAVSANPEL